MSHQLSLDLSREIFEGFRASLLLSSSVLEFFFGLRWYLLTARLCSSKVEEK